MDKIVTAHDKADVLSAVVIALATRMVTKGLLEEEQYTALINELRKVFE